MVITTQTLIDACLEYALSCAADLSHGEGHIRRVLKNALYLAKDYPLADKEVLSCACALHDCGRKEQIANPSLPHAAVGAKKAEAFLLEKGCSAAFAARVAQVIAAHSSKAATLEAGTEAILLFDADKLEMTGAIGASRALIYCIESGLDIDTAFPSQLIEDAQYAQTALITPRARNISARRASFMTDAARAYQSELNYPTEV